MNIEAELKSLHDLNWQWLFAGCLEHLDIVDEHSRKRS